MENLKTLYFIGLFCLLGCDDKITSVELANQKPMVEYYSRASFGWAVATDTIVESAKVYNNENNINYSISLRSNDSNNNHEAIEIKESKPGGKFFLNNEEFSKEHRVSLDSFSLAYRYYKPQTREFVVKSNDDFGLFKETIFQITFVENEDPLPSLEIRPVNTNADNEYVLDASKSIDQDESLGGFIVDYEYTIDGVVIETPHDKIFHVFGSGRHRISLRVKDNDGLWSEAIVESLTIN